MNSDNDLTELKNYHKYIKPLNNLSNKNAVIPSLNQLKEYGYKGIEPILSNYSKVLYNGEHTTYAKQLCKTLNNNHNISKKGFSVITYNVHGWVTTCRKSHSGKHRNFNEFIDFFKNIDVDVLCLQEIKPIKEIVESNEINMNVIEKDLNYKYLLSKMADIGYKYSFIIDGNPGKITQSDSQYFISHIGIFSKILMQNCKGFSVPGNRSFMICEINNFTIINFHGEVSSNKTNKNLENNRLPLSGPYNNILKLEINLILVYLAMNYSKNNIIFAGDFNYPYKTITKYTKYKRFKSISPENMYKDFLNYFHDTCDLDIQKRITNFNAFTATDFIFANNSIKKTYIYESKILYTDLSDHYPVYCDFIPL